ncbi:uncharacterized mitochondrial protein AtMg00820-like [Vicia villosa]|uniref:uncharacterized mitochondrial protein AtMg00820-like n=1 Tax=Vicia villosa TaxID=3911 RepID=UPI00273B0D69|nr:uncharacterized mitochondrial protein AtMg00820-like [Vicia villosa]
MSLRLQECVITLNDAVDNEGELVHCVLYVDVEPVNATEALKDLKWVKAMNEELKSIEVNNTWSLVEFPQGNKAINVKWVYKVKLNLKGEMDVKCAFLNASLNEEIYVAQPVGFVKHGLKLYMDLSKLQELGIRRYIVS